MFSLGVKLDAILLIPVKTTYMLETPVLMDKKDNIMAKRFQPFLDM